jgi:hypothetical protein
LSIDRRLCILLLCAWAGIGLSNISAAAVPDAQALLSTADQSRGAGLPGIVLTVHVRSEGANRGSGAEADLVLRVKTQDGGTLAEVQEPPRSKGMRLLQVQRNMWLHKPGMKKPVAVSARQRLSGQAALGDVATIGYARDYKPTYLRADVLRGEPCHVLQLNAAQPNTTYDRIVYWISQRSGMGIHAEFQSLSGKTLKSADFQYGATLNYQGRSMPFVSKVSIQDALTSDHSTLEYRNITVQPIAPAEFSVESLQ